VEAAVGAALENRIGAELLPADAVSGSGEAEPLAPSAILAEIIHVERISNAQDRRIGDAALIPASTRAGRENRRRLFAPGPGIARLRQPDAGDVARSGDVPVVKFPSIEERGAVAGDVVALPAVWLWREDPSLRAPHRAVGGDGESGVPRFALVTGVEVIVDAVSPDERQLQDD